MGDGVVVPVVRFVAQHLLYAVAQVLCGDKYPDRSITPRDGGLAKKCLRVGPRIELRRIRLSLDGSRRVVHKLKGRAFQALIGK